MKFTSHLVDTKIRGVNIGAELTIGEYLSFAPDILKKNEFQRKKVKGSGTYELLRRDLIAGCVIPPIILATTNSYGSKLDELVHAAISEESFSRWVEIEAFIKQAAKERELLILDGLQRTLTIESIGKSFESERDNPATVSQFLNHRIRLEIYVGLSKTGILYRMLTLNTGQTPMSFRHQLEILYHDMIDSDSLPNGIKVLREIDERRARGVGRFKYADVVDMLYAYSTGTPMPYDKDTLVGELREIKFLESYSYRPRKDDMKTLLVLYDQLIRQIDKLAFDWSATDAEEGPLRPFGTSVVSILARSQPMAGFGAECKRLVSNRVVSELENFEALILKLFFGGDPNVALSQLLTILDQIAKKAKRIGDAQRAYFQLAFRALFLAGGDAHLDLSKCWIKAQEDYEMMY